MIMTQIKTKYLTMRKILRFYKNNLLQTFLEILLVAANSSLLTELKVCYDHPAFLLIQSKQVFRQISLWQSSLLNTKRKLNVYKTWSRMSSERFMYVQFKPCVQGDVSASWSPSLGLIDRSEVTKIPIW